MLHCHRSRLFLAFEHYTDRLMRSSSLYYHRVHFKKFYSRYHIVVPSYLTKDVGEFVVDSRGSGGSKEMRRNSLRIASRIRNEFRAFHPTPTHPFMSWVIKVSIMSKNRLHVRGHTHMARKKCDISPPKDLALPHDEIRER